MNYLFSRWFIEGFVISQSGSRDGNLYVLDWEDLITNMIKVGAIEVWRKV